MAAARCGGEALVDDFDLGLLLGLGALGGSKVAALGRDSWARDDLAGLLDGLRPALGLQITLDINQQLGCFCFGIDNRRPIDPEEGTATGTDQKKQYNRDGKDRRALAIQIDDLVLDVDVLTGRDKDQSDVPKIDLIAFA